MSIDSHAASPAGDVPLGGLAPADRTLLVSAPLETAVIEIRFTSPASDIEPTTISALRDHLTSETNTEYPGIQPAVQQQMRIDFGTGQAPQVAAESRGWQIQSGDESTHITVMPDVLIMQVNRYARWSTSMKTPLIALLDSLGRMVRPSLVHRIGLRYVNRFQDDAADAAAAWQGRIDDTLLGPVLNPVFGDHVRGAQQQVQIRLDDHHGALLRHGPAPDSAGRCVQYLLDTDVFRHSSFEFDVQEIVISAERLNRTALALFQACVADNHLAQLRSDGPQ